MYFTALTMIDQVPYVDYIGLLQHDSPLDNLNNDSRHELIYKVHSLCLALPALLLTYDAHLQLHHSDWLAATGLWRVGLSCFLVE